MASIIAKKDLAWLGLAIFIGFWFVPRTKSLFIDKPCAKLYSDPNFQGNHFRLRDKGQTINLAEEGIAYTTSNLGWNTTGSLKVAPSCSLNVCNDSYFEGTCINLKSGSYPQSFNKDDEGLDFTNTVSASCRCDKECKCEDIFMKKASCARGYLDGSCTICDSFYTDMTGSNPEFSLEFRERIKAFRIRKGCTITLYSEEEYKGEEQVIADEIIPSFNGVVGSFQCFCNDSLWEPRKKPPRPKNYPQLIDIPGTLDGVLELLSNQTINSHPGLRAALSSLQGRRSSRNAYILVLGSTGSGKSHTINMLFDNPNITKVGWGASTTKEINEYRISVPLDDLGIQNTQLRIIDTPGLGDTGGLYEDAKFLATLDMYLANHEELKNRIPNIVLILHKFNDNRVNGESSVFVKMLRGLDTFRHRITDESYSNVIFTFTHFCYAPKRDKKKPEARLSIFKSIIENYSLFPKPTTITVAENKPKEQDLPMVNGYAKLPNGEYYPRNLFDKMELVAEKGGDVIGLGVFRHAFRDSTDFNISFSSFPILQTSDKLDYFFRILSNAVFAIEKTEISQLLKQTWEEQIGEDTKKNYPTSLPYLQKALNIRNINTMSDLPKTFKDILSLLTALKHDHATLELISKGLNIKYPDFPSNIEVGYSYNVFKDSVLPTSPFNLEIKSGSDIGFLVPAVVTCQFDPSIKETFRVFNTKSDYIINRLENLGISGIIPEENWKGYIKPGHNLKSIAFKNDSCSVSASREFRLYKILLNENLTLTDDFIATVKKLSPFNETNYENVDEWKHFFNNYGTHVVNWGYVGGSIEIRMESDKPFDIKITQNLFNLIKFAEEIPYKIFLENATNQNLTEPEVNLFEGTSHNLRFVGGDKTYYTNDLSSMSIEDASKLILNWKNSLKYFPSVLHSDLNLIPISKIAKRLGQKYASEIEKASELLFNSNLRYIPPKNSEPLAKDRDNTKLIGDLLLAQQQATARFQQTILEMEKRAAEDKTRFEQQLRTINENSANDKKRYEDLLRKSEQREADLRRQISSSNSGGGSCLKEGTAILMADTVTSKPVEEIIVGDIVLDMNFQPTKVLGTSFEYLLDAKFYGFNNNTSFFTSTHLFAGPPLDSNQANKFKLFAQDVHRLLSFNPLMKYLNVTDFASKHTPAKTTLYTIQRNPGGKIRGSELYMEATSVAIFEDPAAYDPKTKVYFLQVDNPSGTYIANGFVCRHEFPPVEHWPNTMGLLFGLMNLVNLPAFSSIQQEPYDLPVIKKIERATTEIAEAVQNFIKIIPKSKEDQGSDIITIKNVNVMSARALLRFFPIQL